MVHDQILRRKRLINRVLLTTLIFLASAVVIVIVLALIGPYIGTVYSSIGPNL